MLRTITPNSEMSFAVWGTGAYGAMVLAGMNQKYGLIPSFFVDLNVNNQGTDFLGVPVIGPSDLLNSNVSHIYLAQPNIDYVLDQFQKNLPGSCSFVDPTDVIIGIDYSAVNNSFTVNRLETLAKHLEFAVKSFNNNHHTESEKVYLNSLDLVVTQRCSLKCADCSNLMQYFDRPQNADTDLLLDSLRSLLTSVTSLNELRVIGGEPLVNSAVYDILHHCSDISSINSIVVYTNGTIVPSEEKLTELSLISNLVFKISDYGPNLSRKARELVSALENHGIYTIIEPITEWQDSGRIVEHNDSPSVLSHKYGQCCVRDCLTLIGSKLFMCPFSANLYDVLPASRAQTDFLDIALLDGTLKPNHIKAFIYQRRYLSACMYCNGRDHNVGKIPAAVQTRRPLVV